MYMGTVFLNTTYAERLPVAGFLYTIVVAIHSALYLASGQKQICILCLENNTTGFFGCSSSKKGYNGYNESCE